MGNETRRSGRRALRLIWVVLGLVVLVYAVGCTMLYLMQDSIMFPRYLVEAPKADGPPSEAWEQWWLETDEGTRTEAWFRVGEGVSVGEPGPAVVYFHGNGELIDHRAGMMGMYTELGISVLMVEYRGYGRSTGTPSEQAILEDAGVFVERLRSRGEVDVRRLVFHGSSIGGAVAASLSVAEPARALILESTFFNTASMAKKYFVPSFLIRSPFRTDRAVEEFDGPVLVLHGEQDSLIPVTHAERLAGLSDRAVLRTGDGDHNDFPRNWMWYQGEIAGFLRGAGVLERGAE